MLGKKELKKLMLSIDNDFIDNEYLNKYIDLVIDENTKKEKFITNSHHIIPRSVLKYHQIKLSNKQNISILTIKNHIMAHYYLCLCANKNTKVYYLLLCALSMMIYGVNINTKDLLKDFNSMDLNTISSLIVEKNILLGNKMKQNTHAKDKKLSKETCLKMSISRTGHITSTETKNKIAEKSLGRRWMFKDNVYSSVPKDKVEIFLNHGWIFKGRPCSEKQKEQISLKNKGSKRTLEARKKMSEKKKGKSTWNKGIPCREETKLKLSLANKGRPSNRKGCKLSNEAKEKISKSKKGKPAWNKGVPMSSKQKEKLRQANLGKKQSQETIEKRKNTIKRNKELKEMKINHGDI